MREQYKFQPEKFDKLFQSLVSMRIGNFLFEQSPERVLRTLQCLRILVRDQHYQRELYKMKGTVALAKKFKSCTNVYFSMKDSPFTLEILVELASIFQKLGGHGKQREWLIECGAHKTLVLLLSARDVMVLHCALIALISLVRSEIPRKQLSEMNCTEVLVRIMQDYHTHSKMLAAELLRSLCIEETTREAVKVFESLPVCLSLLHSDDVLLLRQVVGVVERMARDSEASNEIRTLGGIPLILSILNRPVEKSNISLLTSCCSALAQLALNDANANNIRQANGVYIIGLRLFNDFATSSSATECLQANAFRALRFLFSVERNRALFKRLFFPQLFEMFIDVGHYTTDIKSYIPMVHLINSQQSQVSQIGNMKAALEDINLNKKVFNFVGNYAILELLGKGAFGKVFKVKKREGGQTFYAMKEIPTSNSAIFGKTPHDRAEGLGEVVAEVKMIENQLKHPNVVKYHHSFVENDMLYILMENIEGASLCDHFNSLKEKQMSMEEDRIWGIFLQLIQGLRYLHIEKKITHRDLTPSNVMLGDNDVLKITDFGLARKKQSDASVMESVVGTIVYSAPEIIQHESYGEKVDIWAAGCILYQMAALQPPFYSTNMLSLAKKNCRW